MYTVKCITSGNEYLLHYPADRDCSLLSPTLTVGMGTSGSLAFVIPPDHRNRDQVLPLVSEINVYDDDEWIFSGRRTNSDDDFYNMRQVTCEGDLSYLVDSRQRPFVFDGTSAALVSYLLDNHNAQVEDRKKIYPGNIQAGAAAGDLSVDSSECVTTLAALQTYLVDIYGGYLRIRHADGKRYLDWVRDYGGINDQVIRFGENLLDLTKHINPETLITAIIPYGASVEDEETEETRRVGIEDVNGGLDYIYDQSAVNTYGWIWGSVTFDDVTEPDVLYAKARAYLDECIGLPMTVSVSAVDLSKAGVDVTACHVGYWTQVESAPHGISQRFLLTQKTIHLDDPGKDTITLGRELQTMTSGAAKNQQKVSARIEQVANNASKEIRQKIDNATSLITGANDGYVVIDIYDPVTGKKKHPWRILIMDSPEKDIAANVIQINQNGIGFSTTGINGPYRNAWTIDGNLTADFVTAGTMLADRIRGGTLELGGTGLGKDGVILIKNKDDEVVGRLDVNGVSFENGTIQGGTIRGANIYGGDDIPFEATSGHVKIGDFVVDDRYGRHIFQSSDETTGMSTGDVGSSGKQLWFWVGYGRSTKGEAHLLVNTAGQTHVFGELWLNGRNILDYIEEGGGGCTGDGGSCTGACYDAPCSECGSQSSCPSNICTQAPGG